MARVLPEKNLGKDLQALLQEKSVHRLDIATAWATEGSGLDAIEDRKKRYSRLKVRTLAGIEGNHTTPEALKRLHKLGEVRIVDDSTQLFHVKLLLLHMRGASLGWIGSANFTGRGFAGNEELVF